SDLRRPHVMSRARTEFVTHRNSAEACNQVSKGTLCAGPTEFFELVVTDSARPDPLWGMVTVRDDDVEGVEKGAHAQADDAIAFDAFVSGVQDRVRRALTPVAGADAARQATVDGLIHTWWQWPRGSGPWTTRPATSTPWLAADCGPRGMTTIRCRPTWSTP